MIENNHTCIDDMDFTYRDDGDLILVERSLSHLKNTLDHSLHGIIALKLKQSGQVLRYQRHSWKEWNRFVTIVIIIW